MVGNTALEYLSGFTGELGFMKAEAAFKQNYETYRKELGVEGSLSEGVSSGTKQEPILPATTIVSHV
ncbi:MAG: hypothetical protein SF053_21600 [Bacteroidia bacterium]|nr:hypothetical protein [Bacteroidia bacterium]